MSGLGNPTQHDDLLNFQLKRLLTLGGAAAVRLCEGRYGIARGEWRVVAALVEGGPTSPSLLAERCSPMDPGRVSRLVAILADKGLVLRRALPEDRRRSLVAATETGRMLYAELFPQLADINRSIVAVLDEREQREFEECLRKLTDRARKLHAEGAGVDARADRRLGGARRI
jgi:DNA-binding MarR family transcriptional regulator